MTTRITNERRKHNVTSRKIQQEILALPEAEYKQLRQWFSELDWEKWDQEIEADSEAGKLDFLIAEALEEKEKGTLKDL